MHPARLRVCLPDFRLCLITDRTQTAGRPLPAVVAAALAGGIRAVQLREKDLPDPELLSLAHELRELTRQHAARLLINGRVDIALAVGADGAHLGVSTMGVAEARRLLGTDRLIGYSAHGVAEAERAASDGADFVTLGPIFHTPSKAAYGPPTGLTILGQAASRLTIPVFALGGVTLCHVAEVMAAGASGIAVISAIISAPDPEHAAKTMLEAIESHVPNHR